MSRGDWGVFLCWEGLGFWVKCHSVIVSLLHYKIFLYFIKFFLLLFYLPSLMFYSYSKGGRIVDRNLNVKIDETLDRQINDFCEKNTEVKKSNLVRIALREYLSKSVDKKKSA